MFAQTVVVVILCVLSVLVNTLTYTRMKKIRYFADTNVTSVPPCCGDLLGHVACKRMQEHDPLNFQRRCWKEADFSMIQCCTTCGLDDVSERYAKFFEEETESENCFDRRTPDFCQKFLEKTDVWSGSVWSCSGISANLAFRICRRTCGFCRKDLFNKIDGYFQPTPCGIAPEFVTYAKKIRAYQPNRYYY